MDTIIFDIGRVLLKFDPKTFLSERYCESDVELILSELFLTEQWHGLDRADFTDLEMLDDIKRRHPDKFDFFELVYENWVDMLEPIEENVLVARELKEKGYTLLLLSNFSKTGYGKVRETYEFFDMFDGGVISFEVNACKPEKSIYQQLIFQYGLTPSKCLFIDDLAKNIDAAGDLGIRGLWLPEDVELKSSLEKLGIL